jgi:hypothetical protein
MRKLTQSLLQLARYDSGQELLERSVFDLDTQTQACVELPVRCSSHPRSGLDHHRRQAVIINACHVLNES